MTHVNTWPPSPFRVFADLELGSSMLNPMAYTLIHAASNGDPLFHERTGGGETPKEVSGWGALDPIRKTALKAKLSLHPYLFQALMTRAGGADEYVHKLEFAGAPQWALDHVAVLEVLYRLLGDGIVDTRRELPQTRPSLPEWIDAFNDRGYNSAVLLRSPYVARGESEFGELLERAATNPAAFLPFPSANSYLSALAGTWVSAPRDRATIPRWSSELGVAPITELTSLAHTSALIDVVTWPDMWNKDFTVSNRLLDCLRRLPPDPAATTILTLAPENLLASLHRPALMAAADPAPDTGMAPAI